MIRPSALHLTAIAVIPFAVGVLQAQEETPADAPPAAVETITVDASRPIIEVMQAVDADVHQYNEHLVILSSPFMEGRLPGTAGMERAKQYMEYHFNEMGLQQPFEHADGASFRQAFPLSSRTDLVDQGLEAVAGGAAESFMLGSDYEMTGMGGSAGVEGEAVFVGYSINDGPDGFTTFVEGDDLRGKIAVMLRFEPMDAQGQSLWTDTGRWSGRASFSSKLRAITELEPAGVIIVNPPGADDPRVAMLVSDASQIRDAFPIFMMTPEAGDRLVQMGQEQSLMELRQHADGGGGIVELGDLVITLHGDAIKTPVNAENVAALLPGRGDLADEYIVVGAHLDHLGMGDFGSREGPGKLHPGADDNASGSAAVLLIAESMVKAYDALDDDAPARSVLFMGFSAEESGLNGSRYYADHPIAPIQDHVLMTNFDMIGRLDQRLSVAGIGTGQGMREWIEPFAEACELDVVLSEGGPGSSDHTSFMQKEIPVVFGSIPGIHDDYHTSRDTYDQINRLGATQTSRLFHAIVLDAAIREERIAFAHRDGSRGELLSKMKVRLGISGNRPEGGDGVLIHGLADGGSAAEAGLREGDLIMEWDEEPVENLRQLLELLASHEPGDVAKASVERDGKAMAISIELQAR
jgi:hypothetical protein